MVNMNKFWTDIDKMKQTDKQTNQQKKIQIINETESWFFKENINTG